MTRPQRYPGASMADWWQTKWGGSPMTVNTLVLHTTEALALPDYDGGSQAPTLTAVPDVAAKRLVWFQHFDIDTSARALVNAAGGVETNTLNVAQVELGGTCDYAHRATWGTKAAGVDYVYWPQAPDWALQGVADFVAWLHANHGVPLSAPAVWLAYGPDSRRPGVTPAAYGASPARMSAAAWAAFSGVCGHSHVPENDHGDPGAFPISTVLAMATGTHTSEAAMTAVDLTDSAIAKLAQATWDHKEDSPTAAPGTDAARRMGAFVRNSDQHAAAAQEQGAEILKAVQAMVPAPLSDAQVAALGDRIAGALGDGFADKVADLLAARLAN